MEDHHERVGEYCSVFWKRMADTFSSPVQYCSPGATESVRHSPLSGVTLYTPQTCLPYVDQVTEKADQSLGVFCRVLNRGGSLISG